LLHTLLKLIDNIIKRDVQISNLRKERNIKGNIQSL
jgi:hypothetical protein